MKRIANACIGIGLLAALAALTGCGSSGVVPVAGKVTYEGKPIKGLSVQFTPTDGRRGSTGYTKDDGTFKLIYTINENGAVTGSHEVTMIWVPDSEGDKATPEIQAILKEAGQNGKPIPIEITGPTTDLEFAFPLAKDE